MICVRLDANVYVSAALARAPQAPSLRLLEAAADRRIRAIACPTLLAEVGSVLARARLRRYLSLEQSVRFVADVAAVTEVVSDPTKPYPALCRDPADDYLLALAANYEVDALGTGDRDLLEMHPGDLAILAPRALIERIDQED